MLQQIWQRLVKPTGPSKAYRVFYLLGAEVKLLAAQWVAGSLRCELSQHSLSDASFPENLLPLIAQQPSGCQVAVVLDASHYQLIPLDKPKLPPEEIPQALPWLLKDLSTIAPDNMQLDYLDIPGNPNQPRINIVVSPKLALQQLCAQLHKHKLQPTLIAPQEWLSMELVEATGPTRLLLIQHAGQPMLVQVIREGQLCFSRHLRGFDQFCDTPVEQLQYGLLDNLLLEVQRSMDFIESQLKLPPVREIVLLMAHPALAEVISLFKQAGFNQAQPLHLPSNMSWASTLDIDTCWPAVAALQQMVLVRETP